MTLIEACLLCHAEPCNTNNKHSYSSKKQTWFHFSRYVYDYMYMYKALQTNTHTSQFSEPHTDQRSVIIL